MFGIVHFTEIMCPFLPTPSNGTKSIEDVVAESTVSFNCISGYALSGPSTLRCELSGNWNGSVPNCLGECSKVRLYEN